MKKIKNYFKKVYHALFGSKNLVLMGIPEKKLSQELLTEKRFKELIKYESGNLTNEQRNYLTSMINDRWYRSTIVKPVRLATFDNKSDKQKSITDEEHESRMLEMAAFNGIKTKYDGKN